MKIWLTADEHFGHRNIIAFCERPFAGVDEMAAELIARNNAVVAPGDVVLHVGDFALDESLVPVVLRQLHGEHRLICGNHDACHPKHRRAEAAKRRYLSWGFSTVAVEMRLGDFTIAHLPYTGDHTAEDRYAEWRPKDEGRWLLHGHVHGAWKVRERNDQRRGGPVGLRPGRPRRGGEA